MIPIDTLEVQIVRSLLKIPQIFDATVIRDKEEIIFSFCDDMIVVKKDGSATHIYTTLNASVTSHVTRVEQWRPR